MPTLTPSLLLLIARLTLGIFLVSTAALKVVSLFVYYDRPHSGMQIPVWLLYLAVWAELATGLRLLAGTIVRGAAAIAFASLLFLSLIAAYQISQGLNVCPCFGVLSLSPWGSFAVDSLGMTAIVACGWLRPGGAPVFAFSARRQGAVLLTLLLFATLSGGLMTAGVRESLRRARIEAAASRLANGADRSRVSLSRNFGCLLASFGLRAPPARLAGAQFQNCGVALERLTREIPVGDAGVVEVSDRVLDAVAAPALFEIPLLATTRSGESVQLLGKFHDDGVTYFQVLTGAAAPALIPGDILAPSLDRIWAVGAVDAGKLRVQTGRPSEMRIGAARITVDRLYQNFGPIRTYEAPRTEFMLSNVGTSVVEIGTISVSCGCIHPNLADAAKVLSPGGSVALSVAVDIGVGNLRQTLTIPLHDTESGATESVVLELLGSQVESMKVSPGELSFGRIRSGDPVSRTILISEVPTDRFTIDSIHAGAWPIGHEVTTKTSTGRDLRSYAVSLTLRPAELRPGGHSGVVRIETSSKRVPYLDVGWTAEVPPDVQMEPGVLSFGKVPVGERRRLVAELRSANARRFEVLVPAVETGPFVVHVEPDTDRSRCAVIVECAATSEGPASLSVPLRVLGDGWETIAQLKCAAFVTGDL
jgi:hypothetical protein